MIPRGLRRGGRYHLAGLVQALSSVAAAHSDLVSAECILDVIKRIADLCGQRFTGCTLDNVLVLTAWEFGSAAKRLPQPDCWHMSYGFASHEMF